MGKIWSGVAVRVPVVKRLIQGAATATLIAGLSLPALAQAVGGTGGTGGTGSTVVTTSSGAAFVTCTVPSGAQNTPGTGSGAGIGVGTGIGTGVGLGGGNGIGTGSNTGIGNGLGLGNANQTRNQFACGAPGAALTSTDFTFAAEALVPANFVLAASQPTLPTSVATGISSRTSQLRQFISLTGNVLTVDFAEVPVGAVLPTGTATVTPTGTLLTQIRIRVENVVVTGGGTPTMLFSGVVIGSSGSTSTGTATGSAATGGAFPNQTPLVPNLFGTTLVGRAAAVSLAFNQAISFPGLGNTPTAGATGTGIAGSTSATGTSLSGMFNGGNGASVQASMVGVLVAGSFAFSSPTGFAALSFPTTAAGVGTPTTISAPLIVFAPVPGMIVTPQVQLDASQSISPNGGTLTFSWQSIGANVANVINQNSATPIIQFSQPGVYVIQLTVTDASGNSSTAALLLRFRS